MVHRLPHFLRVSPCLAHPHGPPCHDSSRPGSSSPDTSPLGSSPSSGKTFPPRPWLPRVLGGVLGSNPGDDTGRSSPVCGYSTTNLSRTAVNIPGKYVYTFVASNDGRMHDICVAKVGIFSWIHEAMGSLPDLAAFFLFMNLCRGYVFYIITLVRTSFCVEAV